MFFPEVPANVKAITASTYTVTNRDWGALITNRGGGALTVTLPAPAGPTASAPNKGAWVAFYVVAAGDFVITTSAADELVLLNNAAADSLTFSEASLQIGNSATAVSDGQRWLVYVNLAAEDVGTTVTDA